MAPVEPKNLEAPKEKTPPSRPTIQYPAGGAEPSSPWATSLGAWPAPPAVEMAWAYAGPAAPGAAEALPEPRRSTRVGRKAPPTAGTSKTAMVRHSLGLGRQRRGGRIT